MVLSSWGQQIYVRDFCVFDTYNLIDNNNKNPTVLFMSTGAGQELSGTNQGIEI